MENIEYTLEVLTDKTILAKKIVDEYKKYLEDKNVLSMEELNKKYYYKSFPTACVEAQAKYGAENIIMIQEDYHGLHEDDYCNFVYWNNVTGETFKDQWSTAYAAPAYNLFRCIDFQNATRLGILDMNKMFEYLKSKEISKISDWKCFSNPVIKYATYNLKAKVSKGRKWKGEGYLINTSTFNFVIPGTFGGYERVNRVAHIFDPITNQIHEVNPDYIELVDYESIVNDWKQWAIEIINKSSIENISTNDFSLDCGNISFEKYLAILSENSPIDYSTAVNVDEVKQIAKKIEKLEKLKEKKMPKIIEWVKTNTDKESKKEIEELAERIFKKHYTDYEQK